MENNSPSSPFTQVSEIPMTAAVPAAAVPEGNDFYMMVRDFLSSYKMPAKTIQKPKWSNHIFIHLPLYVIKGFDDYLGKNKSTCNIIKWLKNNSIVVSGRVKYNCNNNSNDIHLIYFHLHSVCYVFYFTGRWLQPRWC